MKEKLKALLPETKKKRMMLLGLFILLLLPLIAARIVSNSPGHATFLRAFSLMGDHDHGEVAQADVSKREQSFTLADRFQQSPNYEGVLLATHTRSTTEGPSDLSQYMSLNTEETSVTPAQQCRPCHPDLRVRTTGVAVSYLSKEETTGSVWSVVSAPTTVTPDVFEADNIVRTEILAYKKPYGWSWLIPNLDKIFKFFRDNPLADPEAVEAFAASLGYVPVIDATTGLSPAVACSWNPAHHDPNHKPMCAQYWWDDGDSWDTKVIKAAKYAACWWRCVLRGKTCW